jgi:hypothetical protein
MAADLHPNAFPGQPARWIAVSVVSRARATTDAAIVFGGYFCSIEACRNASSPNELEHARYCAGSVAQAGIQPVRRNSRR